MFAKYQFRKFHYTKDYHFYSYHFHDYGFLVSAFLVLEEAPILRYFNANFYTMIDYFDVCKY